MPLFHRTCHNGLMKTLVKTLSENPDYYDQLKLLIEKSFNYHHSQDVTVDFHPLYQKNNWNNLHLLLDSNSNRLIGHIGLLPKRLSLKNKQYKGCFIGGVCIHPEYQGEKLFTPFFENILQQSSHLYSLFFLWSDLSDLYEKLDFFECGHQVQFGDSQLGPLPQNFVNNPWPTQSKNLLNQMNYIYNTHCGAQNLLHPKRSSVEWITLEKIHSTRLYLYVPSGDISRPNNVKGFFFVDKGMDLTGIIHDYACLPEHQEEFFKTLHSYKVWRPFEFKLNQHSFSKDLFLAHLKIGNQQLFSELVRDISHGKMEILGITSSSVSYLENGREKSMLKKEYLRLLFGPCQDNFQYYTPIYIGGLDSI